MLSVIVRNLAVIALDFAIIAATQGYADTHSFPAFPVAQVRAVHDSTHARFAGDKRYSKHECADYFKALFELSNRLMDAAEHDALAVPQDTFMRFEVDRQAYEARQLLYHLGQELDMIDHAAALAAKYAAKR